MALLFASPTDDPAKWLQQIAAALPELEVRVWPEVGDRAEIAYAAVWNPPKGLLAGLPNLQAIFNLGAGVDALLADPTLPRHVPLVRLVEPGLTEGMTEYVLQQVLDAHRHGRAYRQFQAAAQWRPLPETLARERGVGVLGLGELGAAAATALVALHFRVAGWSRNRKQLAGVACFAGDAELAPFLAECEILVCLLPLTSRTEGILNARTFAALPPGAFVINAARGGHLVEADLLAALDDGRLAGAALDVFATEPLPPDHPFWRHPKITITPHVAGPTHARTAVAWLVENIRRVTAGQPLLNCVDPESEY